MKALHIPSQQLAAKVIGYNHGRKAHMVKLDNGTNQLWCAHSTRIIGEHDMTTKILMTITGSKGKMYQVIDRVFDTVEEAHEYLRELTTLNPIKDIYVKNENTSATLTNGWNISCNYDLNKILKLKPVDKDLSEYFPFELRKTMKMKSKEYSMSGTIPVRDSLNDNPADIKPLPKKKSSGKMVQLKELTKDTRKARVVLRQLVRQKKISKPARWEWESGSAELDIVTKALDQA